MHPHSVPPTTHTVEMAQINELNDRLATQPKPVVTARDLGLTRARPLHRGAGATLNGSEVLTRLTWDGPPEFPYIHGCFRSVHEPDTPLVADLHTAGLRELSRRLGYRHVWGVGSPDPNSGAASRVRT